MLFYDLFRLDPEFIKIKAGEVLFREGDHGDDMYVLISGKAEVSIGGVLIGECAQEISWVKWLWSMALPATEPLPPVPTANLS